MQRRKFLATATGATALGLTASWPVFGAAPRANTLRTSFAVDDNRVRLYTHAVKQPIKIVVAADTHLFRDDDRGDEYAQYSKRMAAAYHQTKHFQSGKATNPEASFEDLLIHAQKQDANMLALVGDVFSFPSEAAIDWVTQKLKESQLPFCYVAGNHDWHYEGMPGSLQELRSTWTERRLKPLYQGRNPLMAAYDVGEVRVVMIDNSDYQILPLQLDFWRQQIATGKPLILALHIPLYTSGRPLGFGCGHPDWGSVTDKNHSLERRPRWPEMGHTQTTFDFHQEVFQAPNLLGVFAGHTHRDTIDVVHGVPQFVTDDNASGGFLDVQVLPPESRSD